MVNWLIEDIATLHTVPTLLFPIDPRGFNYEKHNQVQVRLWLSIRSQVTITTNANFKLI